MDNHTVEYMSGFVYEKRRYQRRLRREQRGPARRGEAEDAGAAVRWYLISHSTISQFCDLLWGSILGQCLCSPHQRHLGR